MKTIELVGLLIVVLGWAATHLFSEARERRKEERAKVDKFVEALTAVASHAREFHEAEAFSDGKRAALQSSLDRLDRRLGRIRIVRSGALVPQQIALRRSITLRNADRSTFAPQKVGSKIIQSIDEAVIDLEDCLEAQYSAAYPPGFPYFYLKMPAWTQKLASLGSRGKR